MPALAVIIILKRERGGAASSIAGFRVSGSRHYVRSRHYNLSKSLHVLSSVYILNSTVFVAPQIVHVNRNASFPYWTRCHGNAPKQPLQNPEKLLFTRSAFNEH